MAYRQLSLFDCFQINTNKKRTERGITKPETRSDVEKPEESHENKKSRQFNDVFVENPNTSTTIASSTFSTLCYDHSKDSQSELLANQSFQTLKFNDTLVAPADIAATPDHSPVQPRTIFPAAT